ncbi:MAG: ABC transporter substrate-binding protein [Alphaproteobacteria bacterium]|nr:ABC transporter substrate-binding protein [Alphaproteobacteria bacterium]
MRKSLILAAGAALTFITPALAETFKLAVPQRGLWETAFVEIGAAADIFKKEGIDIEPLYTRGGSETVQAVLSGSVDLAVSNGLLGTIGGYSRGAPLRVTGAAMTGTPDVFWYARSDSGIKSIKDIAGKKIGFSQPGSSTHLIIQTLLDHFKIKAEIVPSGSPSGSFTMTMSKQIDLGWSVPPFRLQEIAEGKVNIVMRGVEVPSLQDQTVRVHISTAQTIARKRDLMVRFHRALAATLDYAYSNDAALVEYAKMAKITPDLARQVRDQFHPKANMQLKEIRGLQQSLDQALQFKNIAKPMKPDDVKGMFEILVP